jgi:hypothetical protein
MVLLSFYCLFSLGLEAILVRNKDPQEAIPIKGKPFEIIAMRKGCNGKELWP